MEERRLKNILSHLSPCSSPLGNSAVLNVINKAEVLERREKNHVLIPDNVQWNPQHFVEEQKAYRSLFKSRSSSNISESRQSGFVEETFMRGACSHPTTPSSQGADPKLKAESQCKQTDFFSPSFKHITGNPSPKELPSHSFIPHSELTTQKCGCLRSKSFSSEVEGDSLCLHTNDRGATLRRNVRGYSLDTTGLTASDFSRVQSSSRTQLEHVCSLPDAKLFELEAQCKSFNSNKVIVDNFQAGEVNHRLGITDDRKFFRDQAQRVMASELRAEGNHDKNVSGEHQTSTEALNILQSSAENLLACRDMHMLDSQPVDAAGSMTLSRNNAMTGQRRRIVEDCIFCLIIQGQSPAFKLYEDEMCVCILDVHPLTHGHSLLIPKAHFPSLELTPPEVAAAMCATVPFISMAIMEATNCDSFNLLVNSGKAAGQVVFHTHFHIIPRRSGDNLWRSEDDCRRALPVGHETALLVQQIRHNLSNKCL